MKKAIIILILATVILALFTFNNSFVTGSGGGSATGTSVVLIAKADYLAVRVKMTIIANGPGIDITYPNGTQEKLTSYHIFEMLLPKTGSSTQNFGASTPGQLVLTNKYPCGATVISNTTDSYINSLSHYSSDIVELYLLRIDGSAWISVAYYGVAA